MKTDALTRPASTLSRSEAEAREEQFTFIGLDDMEIVATYAEQLSRWLLQTGNRFFEALFGDSETALRQLRKWVCRRDSEFSGFRATLALVKGSPVGMVIALPGDDALRGRRADLLALVAASSRAARDKLKENLTLLAGASAPIEKDDYYIRSLAVDDGCRCQGVGRALLARAMSNGTLAGYRRFRLDVETDNAAAQSLYKAVGYRVIKTSFLTKFGFGVHSMLAER